jgi:hypothetical protein
MAAISCDGEEMPSSRDPNFTSLSSFLSSIEGKSSDEWGHFKDEGSHTFGTGKYSPSNFEMRDMTENSEGSRPLKSTSTPPEPFAIAEGELKLLLFLR